MERKAVLIYLRDVWDLEFAKRKLTELYDQEKKKVKQKLEYLETPHYCDEVQKNWIPSAIALGVFGVMTLICFLIMQMRSYTLVDLMRSAVFRTFFWTLLVIFVVLLILTIIDVVKSDRRLTEAREANERERERLEENEPEIRRVKAYWEKRSKYLKDQYSTVCRLLDSYYGQNLIAKPYRNLPSLIYLYDFMSTSQSTLSEAQYHAHLEEGIKKIEAKLDTVVKQKEKNVFYQRISEAHDRALISQHKRMIESLRKTDHNNVNVAEYAKLSDNYGETVEFFGKAEYLEEK